MGLIVRSGGSVIQSGEGCEFVLRNPGRSPASADGPMAALCVHASEDSGRSTGA